LETENKNFAITDLTRIKWKNMVMYKNR
jgi:hypothetical protein